MLFFNIKRAWTGKINNDITVNSQLKQSLCSAKDLTLLANDSITPIFELCSTEFMIYPIIFF